jgi:hypothetical protein
MGSKDNAKHAYETSTLSNLTRAFEATWVTLEDEHGPNDEDQLLAVRSKLLALAADGLTDPRELKRKVLESLKGNPSNEI